MKNKLLAFLLILTMTLSLALPENASAAISKDGSTYTVENGDNLTQISRKTGTDWKKIAKLNNLKDPYVIDIGQVLKLTEVPAKKKTPEKTDSKKESNTTTEQKTDNKSHGTTVFSDITYKRPDFKQMRKDINSILGMLDKKGQSKKIAASLEQLCDDIVMARTMGRFLYIKCCKDVTDSASNKEYAYVTAKINAINNSFIDLIVKLLKSRYKGIVKKELTEDEIASVYDAYKNLDDRIVSLSKEITDLTAEYSRIINASTIDVNGKSMSMSEITQSTTLTEEKKNSYYTKMVVNMNTEAGNIYLKLIEKQKELAKLNNYDNVADFYYNAYGRDYKKEDIARLSKYVKESVVPLYQDLLASFTQEEITSINTAPDLFTKLEPTYKKYFASISKDMLAAYNYMKKYDMYDLASSPYKKPLNYTTYLSGFKTPYISLTPKGNYLDVTTFIHEFGHFYGYYQHGDALSSNIDIIEIHSQANEVLFTPYYKAYGDAYLPIQKNQMLVMLGTIINGILEDEFQQYVFSHEITSVTELNKLYYQLKCDYGLINPDSGYEQDWTWILIPHTFEMPFYYISYAISAFPALEIYTTSLTDRKAAIQMYNKIIYYGTEYGYTNLLVRCHMHTPFNQETIDTLVETLRDAFDLTKDAAAPAA